MAKIKASIQDNGELWAVICVLCWVGTMVIRLIYGIHITHLCVWIFCTVVSAASMFYLGRISLKIQIKRKEKKVNAEIRRKLSGSFNPPE